MEDFNSETDSDYTSYWRDWVSGLLFPLSVWVFWAAEGIYVSTVFGSEWDYKRENMAISSSLGCVRRLLFNSFLRPFSTQPVPFPHSC